MFWKLVLHQTSRNGIRSFSKLASNFQFVEFRDLTDWSSIKTRLESVGPSLASAHIGAAFSQTQKLLPRPPTEFLETLSQKALTNIHLVDIKTSLMVLHSCTHLAYFNEELLDGMANVILEQLYFLEFANLAKVIHQLGCLHEAWDDTVKSPFPQFEPLVQAVASRVTFNFCSRTFDAQMGSVLLLGLAKLQYKEPLLMKHVSALLMQSSITKSLTSSQLTSILFALSRLNHRDVILVRQYVKEASQKCLLEQFTNNELSNVIYSLSRLGIRGKVLVRPILREASKQARMQSYTNHSLCNILFAISFMEMDSILFQTFLKEAFHQDRLPSFSNLDFTTLLHALSKHPIKDTALLSNLLQEVTNPSNLEKFTAKELSILLFGFIRCEVFSASDLIPITQILDQDRMIYQLSHENLSKVIYSLGSLHEELGDVICSRLQTPYFLKNFTIDSIIKVVIGVTESKTKISALDTLCLEEAFHSHRMKLYTSSQLNSLLGNLVKMKADYNTYEKKIEMQILNSEWYKKIEPTELIKMIICLVALKSRLSPCLEVLLSHALQSSHLTLLSNDALVSLAESCVKVNYSLQNWMPLVDELTLKEKVDSMKGDILANQISVLNEAKYDNPEFWKLALEQAEEELSNKNLSLNSRLRILHSLGANISHVRSILQESGFLERLIASFRSEHSMSMAQIGTFFHALSVFAFHNAEMVEYMISKLQKCAFKSKEYIGSLGKCLGACFQLNHSPERLLHEIQQHFKGLHETLMIDNCLPIEHYLTHELVTHFMLLKSKDNKMEDECLETCLDLVSALECRSVALKPNELISIYLSFKTLTYQPTTPSQARLIRRSMDRHLELEKSQDNTYHLKQEVIDDLRERYGLFCNAGVVVEGAELPVDVLLSKQKKAVVLFQKPCLDLNFHKDQETGFMCLKRLILEKHGYRILPMDKDLFDALSQEEKLRWLVERHDFLSQELKSV